MNCPYIILYLVILLCYSCRSSIEYIDKAPYQNLNQLQGEALRTALHAEIRDHHRYSYGELWDLFDETDLAKKTIIWDIYAFGKNNNPRKQPYAFEVAVNQCGNYRREGDCYNREHAFPKSWWGGSKDTMYSDLFHIYPTDGYVNNIRGNHPYGETDHPQKVTLNGSEQGPSSIAGYEGTIFEPIDVYKGDLARTYFYMLIRYQPRIQKWKSPMLENGDFAPWARVMLLRWHREDPVSRKEKQRNQAIHDLQGNYNPFILHPEWAERIWGNEGK